MYHTEFEPCKLFVCTALPIYLAFAYVLPHTSRQGDIFSRYLMSTKTEQQTIVAVARMRAGVESLRKDMGRKYESCRSMRAKPPTGKRERESAYFYRQGRHLERLALTMQWLADLREAGTLRAEALGITSRTALEAAYSAGQPLVRKLYEEAERPETRWEKIERLTNAVRGAGIPGYFPTPASLARELVGLLGPLPPQPKILEPSAGSGALIDAALEVYPDAIISYCEVNSTLLAILSEKYPGDGLGAPPTLLCRDWDDVPAPYGSPYAGLDAVIMNPPFEKNQDAIHTARAFSHLAPGGVLAAIVSPGLFFRKDGVAEAFRNLCDEFGDGEKRIIQHGAFKESGTGISACMVCLHKPRAVDQTAAAQ